MPPSPVLPVPAAHLDFGSFDAPVDAAELRAFRLAAREPGSPFARSGVATFAMVFVVLFFIMVGGGVAAIFGVLFRSTASSGGLQPVFVIVPALMLAAIVVAGAVQIVRRVRRGSIWQQWYRLKRFATANGFNFVPTSPSMEYPGTVFGLGRDRTGYDSLQSTGRRSVELGSYRYTTGSGKHRRVSRWGYVAVALDRPVPHLLLDARANDGVFSSLPAVFDRDQVLSLEGDFDRHFRLYAPAEYERDALYVFTPDLMALLIDEAGAWDIELVDRWLFLYAPDPIDALDADAWRRALRVADLVGTKVLARTQRYTDARANDGSPATSEAPEAVEPTFARPMSPTEPDIAPAGRRLRGGIRWVSIVGVVVVAAWSLASSWIMSR